MLARVVVSSCVAVALVLAVCARRTARSAPFGWMSLTARASVALAPVPDSCPRIWALIVPLMLPPARGPMTVRPIARLMGLVVPVASVLEVIVAPVLRRKPPGTVTGLIWLAKFQVEGVTVGVPEDSV